MNGIPGGLGVVAYACAPFGPYDPPVPPLVVPDIYPRTEPIVLPPMVFPSPQATLDDVVRAAIVALVDVGAADCAERVAAARRPTAQRAQLAAVALDLLNDSRCAAAARYLWALGAAATGGAP